MDELDFDCHHPSSSPEDDRVGSLTRRIIQKNKRKRVVMEPNTSNTAASLSSSSCTTSSLKRIESLQKKRRRRQLQQKQKIKEEEEESKDCFSFASSTSTRKKNEVSPRRRHRRRLIQTKKDHASLSPTTETTNNNKNDTISTDTDNNNNIEMVVQPNEKKDESVGRKEQDSPSLTNQLPATTLSVKTTTTTPMSNLTEFSNDSPSSFRHQSSSITITNAIKRKRTSKKRRYYKTNSNTFTQLSSSIQHQQQQQDDDEDQCSIIQSQVEEQEDIVVTKGSSDLFAVQDAGNHQLLFDECQYTTCTLLASPHDTACWLALLELLIQQQNNNHNNKTKQILIDNFFSTWLQLLVIPSFSTTTTDNHQQQQHTYFLYMALFSHLLSLDLSWNHRKQIWQHPHVLSTLMYILSHSDSFIHSILQTTTATTTTVNENNEAVDTKMNKDTNNNNNLLLSQESNASSNTSDGDPTRMGRRRKRKKNNLESIPETLTTDTLSFASSSQPPLDHNIITTTKAKEDRLYKLIQICTNKLPLSYKIQSNQTCPHCYACTKNPATFALDALFRILDIPQQQQQQQDDDDEDELFSNHDISFLKQQLPEEQEQEYYQNPLMYKNFMLQQLQKESLPHLTKAMMDTFSAIQQQSNNKTKTCINCMKYCQTRLHQLTTIIDGASCLNTPNRVTLSTNDTKTLTHILSFLQHIISKITTTATNHHDDHHNTNILQDCMLSACRILTSFTHENELASQQLLHRKTTSTTNNQIGAGMQVLFHLLYQFIQLLDQKRQNKYCYDAIVFCFNSLCNILESSSNCQTIITSILTSLTFPTTTENECSPSKNMVDGSTLTSINALSWLTRWVVNQTKTFQDVILQDNDSNNHQSSRDLETQEEEFLVMAGNGFILLACLLRHHHHEKQLCDSILQHIPGTPPQTFIIKTLKAFCNFYHYSVGDLSVAIVTPVAKLIQYLQTL